MDTGVIKYLINDGTFPLISLMATVFFIILIVVGILALFDKKEGNRERFISALVILIIAAFVITCAFSISTSIHKIIEKQATIKNVNVGTVVETTIEEFGKAVGFWEKALYSILDVIAEAVIWVRDFLVGQNISIRQILSKYTSNPIVSFTVSYGGGTINLYNLVLISASFLLFLMVVNSGYKLAKFSYQPNSREDVIKAFTKWFYVLLLMLIIPAVFITAIKIMDTMMSILNQINDSYILSTDTLTVETYGPLAPIAKIYIAYLEFKVYVLMLYRKFIINAFYITIPITVYLWGISDSFESMTLWASTLLMNIFSPIFYSLSFVIGSLILASLDNGKNPIIMSIVSSLCLKVGDELKKIVQFKNSGATLGGSSDVNGISRTVFMVATMARTIKSLASNRATNSNKSMPNSTPPTFPPQNSTVNSKNNSNLQSNSNSNNEASILGTPKSSDTNFAGKENIFTNQNGKLGLGYSSGDAIKNVQESIKTIGAKGGTIKKGAQIAAGVAAGIATGNPILGYAAYKGSGAVLNTAGKAAQSMSNTAKNIKSGVSKAGNLFKSNSDMKAHRRN